MNRYSEFLGRELFIRSNGADELTWESVFDAKYHVPPEHMETPKTVLDLGSNIGLTCAYYRKLWPEARVVGVEMDDGNFALAQRNADCDVFQYAVTDTDDGIVTYDPNEFATSFSLEREYSTTDRSVIPCRLGTLIKDIFRGNVDFVKMDIEGSEWRVLVDPEWPSMVKSLMLELHGDSPLFQARYGENDHDNLVAHATRLLENLGYTVERHPVHKRSVFAWS